MGDDIFGPQSRRDFIGNITKIVVPGTLLSMAPGALLQAAEDDVYIPEVPTIINDVEVYGFKSPIRTLQEIKSIGQESVASKLSEMLNGGVINIAQYGEIGAFNALSGVDRSIFETLAQLIEAHFGKGFEIIASPEGIENFIHTYEQTYNLDLGLDWKSKVNLFTESMKAMERLLSTTEIYNSVWKGAELIPKYPSAYLRRVIIVDNSFRQITGPNTYQVNTTWNGTNQDLNNLIPHDFMGNYSPDVLDRRFYIQSSEIPNGEREIISSYFVELPLSDSGNTVPVDLGQVHEIIHNLYGAQDTYPYNINEVSIESEYLKTIFENTLTPNIKNFVFNADSNFTNLRLPQVSNLEVLLGTAFNLGVKQVYALPSYRELSDELNIDQTVLSATSHGIAGLYIHDLVINPIKSVGSNFTIEMGSTYGFDKDDINLLSIVRKDLGNLHLEAADLSNSRYLVLNLQNELNGTVIRLPIPSILFPMMSAINPHYREQNRVEAYVQILPELDTYKFQDFLPYSTGIEGKVVSSHQLKNIRQKFREGESPEEAPLLAISLLLDQRVRNSLSIPDSSTYFYLSSFKR